jgi:hypothetical protein
MLVTDPCPDHALPLKVGEVVVALHVAEDGVEGGQGRSRGEEVLHVGVPRAVEAGHERKPGVFVEEHEPPGHSVPVRLKAYAQALTAGRTPLTGTSQPPGGSPDRGTLTPAPGPPDGGPVPACGPAVDRRTMPGDG